MSKIARFAPEMREGSVRLLFEQEAEHPSRCAAVKSIAVKVGYSAEALRVEVQQAERDVGRQPGPTTADVQRLKDLERVVKEWRCANEILRTSQPSNRNVAVGGNPEPFASLRATLAAPPPSTQTTPPLRSTGDRPKFAPGATRSPPPPPAPRPSAPGRPAPPAPP